MGVCGSVTSLVEREKTGVVPSSGGPLWLTMAASAGCQGSGRSTSHRHSLLLTLCQQATYGRRSDVTSVTDRASSKDILFVRRNREALGDVKPKGETS